MASKGRKKNTKQHPDSTSGERGTKKLAKGSKFGRGNRAGSQTRADDPGVPAERSGHGDWEEEKGASSVTRELEPNLGDLQGGAASAQQSELTQPRGRSPTKPSPHECRRKFPHPGEDQYRGQLQGVPKRPRGDSSSSVEARGNRSPSSAGEEELGAESRGRSSEREGSAPSRDKSRRRTRSRSIIRTCKELAGRKTKRDESRQRVVYKNESILLWRHASKNASVQLRLDCIRAGSYEKRNVIYLRVSVVTSMGEIKKIEQLLICLQLRCPECDKPWRIARYSPKQHIFPGTPVSHKDTWGGEYGVEAGVNVEGVNLKGNMKNTQEQELQFSHTDCYKLVVTEADHILMSRLILDGASGTTNPPPYFKLQVIAVPPCDSGAMDITADLKLNDSPGDGSWRPVSLKDLKNLHNYDKFKVEEWKERDGPEYGPNKNEW